MAYAIASDVPLKWTHGGTINTVASYKFAYGPSSRNYTNEITFGYATNGIIPNIPPNSTIFISGTTVGFDGLQTDYGNEICISTTIPSNAIPSVVKDFQLVRVDKNIY